ncbi:helix-turn-helix domain-containing protein [Streptomyces genisteinicus]|uniref:Helix-turn-helix domain-containing protein n=1 Tax=Streptomyces genisteinicus TaxID=2768068 RepID=A0A7H0HU20_9ACTN|nr:helix-turn-helix transcriptional regulator [Streptomyces genisteinicus]QNP64036.1 helix-turn-helix domain-containing protein [Streptomyces genisteinicus]
MTQSLAPTVRRRRLGAELRKLRERAGLTAAQAGALIGGNQARISNIEAGRYGVSADRVRTLACHYDCADARLVNALASMTGDRKRGWWEEYRGTLSDALLDVAELEHHSTSLTTAHTSNVPGLLQTLDHAREIMNQVVPSLPASETEHRASFRIKRQAVLAGGDAVPYLAVIHEAALRMQFGGRATAGRQLRHLLRMGEHDHIRIRVIPFAAGAFPGSGQPLYYLCGPVSQLDTVQLDQAHGSIVLDAEAQLHKYRGVLERLTSLSLSEQESADFIHNVLKEL